MIYCGHKRYVYEDAEFLALRLNSVARKEDIPAHLLQHPLRLAPESDCLPGSIHNDSDTHDKKCNGCSGKECSRHDCIDHLSKKCCQSRADDTRRNREFCLSCSAHNVAAVDPTTSSSIPILPSTPSNRSSPLSPVYSSATMLGINATHASSSRSLAQPMTPLWLQNKNSVQAAKQEIADKKAKEGELQLRKKKTVQLILFYAVC